MVCELITSQFLISYPTSEILKFLQEFLGPLIIKNFVYIYTNLEFHLCHSSNSTFGTSKHLLSFITHRSSFCPAIIPSTFMPGLHSHRRYSLRLSRNCERDEVRTNVDIHTLTWELQDRYNSQKSSNSTFFTKLQTTIYIQELNKMRRNI